MTIEPLTIKVYKTTAKIMVDVYGNDVFELMKYFADYVSDEEVILSDESVIRMHSRYLESSIRSEVVHLHALTVIYQHDFICIKI
jgi:hypothetical protein